MSAGLVLAGCNPEKELTVQTRCPPLVQYPAEFQKEAARQLPRAGRNVQVLVNDYGKLRNACRSIGRPAQQT